MQQSSTHTGNARREQRVPLCALIELRSEHGDEALDADAIDVSASGVGVRAAFVPEVGTRLYCNFRCPPEDDAVRAVGEVVWSAWDGPRSGSFGIQFLELDTKSATTIRRYVQPTALVDAAPPPRVANMRIDGVPTPIEADVRLLEKDCIVLEQELSFLRLGRGIEVDVPGRGKERGRIASIELRQGPLDTPTLVFGVLLDEKPEPALVSVAAPAPAAAERAASATLPGEPSPELMSAARASEVAPAPGFEPSPEPLRAEPVRAEPMRALREAPQVVRVPANAQAADEAADEAALFDRTPALVVALKRALTALLAWSKQSLWPWLRARLAAKPAASEGEGEATAPIPFAQRVLLPLARARSVIGAGWAKLQKGKGGRRRTTAPTPRVQRTQPVRTQRAEQPGPAPRNRRLLTLGLALVGVGLGVYALAPRSGADRIRVRTRTSEPVDTAPSATAPALGSAAPSAAPSSLSSAPSVTSLAASEPASTSQTLSEASPVPSEPVEAVGSPRFGEASVPNGRTFVLRMSGPVRGIEGEKRDDGFSVRVPGRLALDRASPIATSHRAVARALILNRGEYAELTVEFLPGMRPKYQVAGKDNTLEVTLERL
jgi:hypothetical protein